MVDPMGECAMGTDLTGGLSEDREFVIDMDEVRSGFDVYTARLADWTALG